MKYCENNSLRTDFEVSGNLLFTVRHCVILYTVLLYKREYHADEERTLNTGIDISTIVGAWTNWRIVDKNQVTYVSFQRLSTF